MTNHLRMQWPSAVVSLPVFARHLVTLTNEIHFVEIGLEAGAATHPEAAKELIGSVRRALEDAMETDDVADKEEIAVRLSALLQALDDEGLSLTATVDQQVVEGAGGVTHIDVLGIVAERRAVPEEQGVAPSRSMAAAH